MTATGPERPAHLGPDVVAVTMADLLQASGTASLGELRTRLATRPRPVRRLDLVAAALAGTPEASAVLEQAAAIDPATFDVAGSTLPRSRRYGHHYLGWVEPLVLARLLTGDPSWTERFATVIGRWHRGRPEYTGDWPGLHVLWYSLGTWARSRQMLAWLDALGDELDDETWAALLANVLGNARWSHQEHRAFRPGNWQLVSASHLVEVGHVLSAFPEAEAWASRGRARALEHLRFDVRPDGGHAERSPGYHRMSLEAFHTIAAIEIQQAATGLSPDTVILSDPRFAEMHHWLATLASEGGWVPALQDSGLVHPGEMLVRGAWLLADEALLARSRVLLDPAQFGTAVAQLPKLTEAHDRRWQAVLAAAPTAPTASASSPTSAVTVLPDSGYSLLQAGPVRAVLNHGPYVEHELESHSHRCVLDLTLDGWGVPLVSEAGGPESYDEPEYQTHFQAPVGHSTVQLDDVEIRGPRTVHGPVTAVLDGWVGWTATLDRIPLAGGPARHRRTVALTDGPSLAVVVDTIDLPIEAAAATRIALRWQLPGEATSAPDDPSGELSWWNEPVVPGSARVGVHLAAAPEPSRLATTTAVHRADHPVPGQQRGARAPLTTIAWTATTVPAGQSVEFVTVLTPVAPGAAAPVVERVGARAGADSTGSDRPGGDAADPTAPNGTGVTIRHPDGTVDVVADRRLVRTAGDGSGVTTLDLGEAHRSDPATPALPPVHHRSDQQHRLTLWTDGSAHQPLPTDWLGADAGGEPPLVRVADVVVEVNRDGTVVLPHTGAWTLSWPVEPAEPAAEPVDSPDTDTTTAGSTRD